MIQKMSDVAFCCLFIYIHELVCVCVCYFIQLPVIVGSRSQYCIACDCDVMKNNY